MKLYRITLTYPGKKTSSMDNKIGPLTRKYGATFETKYRFNDNETEVIITIDEKNRENLKTELGTEKYNFLTLEKIILTSKDD